MSLFVTKNEYIIPESSRSLISDRYHSITRAVNREIWKLDSDTSHSFYVGSYGRGTAINTSDIDVLVEVPDDYYVNNNGTTYNPQSRLLQIVKEALLTTWPRTDIHGDGQVVVVKFSDGMKIEVLPAFPQTDYRGNTIYKYPDSHMGGNWKSTNPKIEQVVMKDLNIKSNGLLFDTCKHIRYIRDNYFSSYHLSGIVIDSFVSSAIGNWKFINSGETSQIPVGTYENELLSIYNKYTLNGRLPFDIFSPGSNMRVNTENDFECLGKVLNKMV